MEAEELFNNQCKCDWCNHTITCEKIKELKQKVEKIIDELTFTRYKGRDKLVDVNKLKKRLI